MSKESVSWHSPRMRRDIQLTRWGTVGTPVLVFPTAGGDAEEIERFHLVSAVSDLLAEGRVKLYSCDSLAGRSWFTESKKSADGARVQNQYDAAIYDEVLPAIRKDCNDEGIEILTAGASLGAFNALAFLCRHPDAVKAAICMSGTYGLSKFLEGPVTEDFYYSSPLHFVPGLDEEGDHLRRVRERFVLLCHGEGKWEDPNESWRVADVLGSRGIPNRVDSWGPDYWHDWVTWREMLPVYLEQLVPNRVAGESASDGS